MLLAVEGGGFFSSSALGYSKGLTLLLLGKKGDEKPMRVTPWNQYQLVDQESDPDLQLASSKNCLVRGCTSFVCFSGAATGLENPSPPKVRPTHHPQDVLKSPPDEKVKENIRTSDPVEDDTINSTNVSSLRSSLKRPDEGEVELVHQNGSDGRGHTERRVQWTDVSGGELSEIREFEPSDHSGSDDEFENRNQGTCSCKIM